MPVRINCPSCKALNNVAEDKRGRKVRCHKCKEPFTVPEAKKARDDEEEVQEARKIKVTASSRTQQDNDDDDDEDDRPVKKKTAKPAAKGGSSMLLMVGGLAVVLLLCLGSAGGIGGYFWWRSKEVTPDKKEQLVKLEEKKNDGKDGNNPKGEKKIDPKGEKKTDPKEEKKIDPKEEKKIDPKEEKKLDPKEEKKIDPKEDPDALRPLPVDLAIDHVPRIKQATVYLKVTLPSGQVAEGSGFFAVEQGIVVTNAHVLGMLRPNSLPPKNVQVVVNSGQGKKKIQLNGEVLGVDRVADLAVVRVKDPNLPAPLSIETQRQLIETQKVYIIGFPFGAQLGEEVTVNSAAVSSFRKDPQTGELDRIQVDKGMDPGNSGGPVVNSVGHVIGVSVAGIRGSNVNFAVPAEKVRMILEGQFADAKHSEAYAHPDGPRLPVRVKCIDPLKRIREMRVEVWTGPPGPPRAGSFKEPQPAAGDSPRQTHAVAYQDGVGSFDVPLPKIAANEVCWIRPIITTAKGTHWGPAQATPLNLAVIERAPADLTINLTAQKVRFSTMTSVDTTTYTVGKKKTVRTERVKAELLEVLFPEDYRGKPAARVKTAYGFLSLLISRDGKTVKHPDLPKGLGYVRTMPPTCIIYDSNAIANFTTVTLNAKNPLREMVSDLNGMVQNPLEAATIQMPNRVIQPMEAFPAKASMMYREEGKNIFVDLMLTCTYQGKRMRDGREEALMTFVGNLQGRNEFLGKIEGNLSGKVGFDVAGKFLSLVQIKIVADAEYDTEFGKITRLNEQDIEVTRVPGNGPKNLVLVPDKGPGPDPTKAIPSPAKGKMVFQKNDFLAVNDPFDPTAKDRQTRMKVYQVPLQAGTTYVISMNSTAFDTYLRLEDPQGKTVAFDDDSGGALNARIIYPATQAGMFRVIATSFEAKSIGAFQLTVQELGDGKIDPKVGPTPGIATKIVGGGGDPQLKDVAQDHENGGLLVGLDVGLGKFFNNDAVKSIRPIYRNAKGEEVTGTQFGKDLSRVVTVKAKPGYAIGALTVNAGLGIDGFIVTFMKVSGPQLDPKDSYQSDYIGGKGGGQSILTGNGSHVIGIIAKSNQKDCTGIGLLLKDLAAPPKVDLTKDPTPGGRIDNPAPEQFATGDVTLRLLTFNQKAGKIAGDLVWANDAKSFFMLQDNGMLQRVNVLTGASEQSIELGSVCGNLAMSAEGLLVSVIGREEVWVIAADDVTKIKKKIAVPGVKRVTAGVNASIAYAAPFEQGGGNTVSVLDLKAGFTRKIVKMPVRQLTATPDGKYVFVQGGLEQLVRFRAQGDDLIEEDSSPRIASNGQVISISPDSKYVCLAAGGGNGKGHPDHPPVGGYSVFIYPVNNLKKPLTGITSGAYPRCLGIDPKSGVILTQNIGKPLIVYPFNADTKLGEYDCPKLNRADVLEFSVSPLGGEAILRTQGSLIHIKINKGGPPPTS